MSARLAALQADIDTARRSADRTRLTILTSLLAKVQRVAKDDGNRAVTDDDVIQGVSRYRKEVEETKDILSKAGRDVSHQDMELAAVSTYLPQQLTDAELDAEIEKALDGIARDKKAIGAIMKHLNGGFRGRFDPKAANARITALLA